MKKSVIVLLCVWNVLLMNAISPVVKKFVAVPAFAGANMGLLVKDLKTGKIIADFQSEKSLMPASNMKLITTATALELLGPDFRFETPLEYDGTIDSKGVLHGNIYVVGTGDPTIGSEVYKDGNFISRWVDAVQKAGIKTVMGQVVANVSAYDKEVTPPDWTWENMGNYYAAGVYGLSVYDNMYSVHFQTGAPGTTPRILGTTPPMYELKFQNMLKAGKTGEDDDDGYLHGAPFSNERVITGVIPSGRELFSIKGDIPNPPLKLVEIFTNKLNDAGVMVAGAPRVEDSDYALHTRFYVHQSPTLAEIIKETNEQSNNLFAEHLFKRLALINNKMATREGATVAVREFWKKQGADVSVLFQHDGCGMSPMNGVSPRFFVQMLTYMRAKSSYNDAFFTSLPIAGKNGTVKRLLAGTPLEGKVRAKSGSIRRVLCYSGYIQKADREYVFSVMVNNYTGSSVNTRKAIENLLLGLE